MRVEGMGAIVTADGVGFRVWAPHAASVSVVGSFNDWSPDACQMTGDDEGAGYWFGFSDGAEVGDEYQFLIGTEAGQLWRVDPYAAQVTNSVGNGVIYDHAAFDWDDDEQVIANLNELAIYEVHIGSLTDDDDASPLDRVTDELDHLVHLGVNAVELMPVAEFAGDTSWGYNPAHLFAVESAYGGPDALKRLVQQAHRLGIAVIMDVVYNHFGPSDLDLWRFDGWSIGDYGGIYFYNDERAHTPWGATRPDYGREEVRQFIIDNATMWIRDYHIDGLRLDMTPYMRSVDGSGHRQIPEAWELTKRINRAVHDEYPRAITIAEDLQNDPTITAKDEDGAHFDAQWDAAFVHPVRAALVAAEDHERSLPQIVDALRPNYDDAFSRVIYTESHDEVANGRARVPHDINPDDPTGWHAQKRSTLGAVLTLTAPGVPMLFQGQEFLQGDYFRDDVPLDWHLAEDFSGILRLYRDLVRLRRNIDGRTGGLTGQHVDILHVDDDARTLVYHRWRDGGPGDDTIIAINLSAHSAHLSLPVPWEGAGRLELNTDASIYSSDFSDTAAFDVDGPSPVEIGPYSALLYSHTTH